MDVVILIGRILFALLFLSSGFGHLARADMMAGYAESLGVKPAKPLVLVTGVQIIVGAVMVAAGIWADLGSLLLVAFLIPTAFLMHPFWKFEGEQQQMDMPHFFKDLSLAGAALMFFGFYQMVGTNLGLTITGPLF